MVKRVVVGITDHARGVPVKSPRREREWPLGRESDEAPGGVELVEQRQEVELVGPAAVQQHERALRLAARRTELMLEQSESVAHVLVAPARGFARGVSERSSWLRSCSY